MRYGVNDVPISNVPMSRFPMSRLLAEKNWLKKRAVADKQFLEFKTCYIGYINQFQVI